MKKRFLMLAAVGAAACCLVAACSNKPSGEYEKLNDMLDASYATMHITLKNSFEDGTELSSSYSVTYSGNTATVVYSVERFQELTLDETHSDVITTLTGTATVQGESVTFTGDDVGLKADIIKVGLTFDRNYFENPVLTSTSLEADVKMPSEFVGTQVACTDMKVSAIFSKYFSYIQVTYKAEAGDQVELCYYFTV